MAAMTIDLVRTGSFVLHDLYTRGRMARQFRPAHLFRQYRSLKFARGEPYDREAHGSETVPRLPACSSVLVSKEYFLYLMKARMMAMLTWFAQLLPNTCSASRGPVS